MNKRLEAIVEGRVQKVLFRDFVRRHANKLSLCGVVKNMEDGTVFVCAEGNEENLSVLLSHLWKGPVFAKVKNVRERWDEHSGAFKRFDIIYYG